MEGVSYREPEVIAKKIMIHVRKFPFYLLAPSNMIIGKIVSNASEGIAPPSRATLSWVHELQRTEVALQNALSVNRLTVARSLVKAMKRPLKDFDNFATFSQSTAIAYSLWERAFEAQFDQQTAEWVTQLIEYQLDAIEMLEAGPLRDPRQPLQGHIRAHGPEYLWMPNSPDGCNDSHREGIRGNWQFEVEGTN